MSNNVLVSLKSDKLRFTGVALDNRYHIDIPAGVTAIIGANGAGKSTLARIIEGGWNFMTNELSSPTGHRPSVKILQFSDIHSLTGFKVGYYQQRFESVMNDEVATVAQLLGDRANTEAWQRLAHGLGLDNAINKRANFLSSGELRKMLIANALTDTPEVLVLDNPYIGLDAPSRSVLDEALMRLAADGVSVLLLVCDPKEISDAVNCFVPMRDLAIGEPVMRGDMSLDDFRGMAYSLFDYDIDLDEVPEGMPRTNITPDNIFTLNHCRVAYGKHTLISDISWSVGRGECWSLTGANGSGKSTLLSLINADNPQAYSNDITLFGRRRGTGESIWDIKHRIGFVSAEMHLCFNEGTHTLAEVVARGLNDTVGNLSLLRDNQLSEAMRWLRALHIEHLADRRFNTLSFGQQKMALLARSMIKNPELLILDEPMHGLDFARKRELVKLINHIATTRDTALIYVTHYVDEAPSCITHHKKLVKTAQMEIPVHALKSEGWKC